MSWTKRREHASDSNQYDRYRHEPEGAAVVFKNGRKLFGYVNGRYFESDVPPEGNVQALRIRYEDGAWYIFAYVDPRDGARAEWVEKLEGYA